MPKKTTKTTKTTKTATTIKTINSKPLNRTFDLSRGAIDEGSRTVELAFSSETREVERWFGIEILDHSDGAVRLDRLRNKGPVLVDHNPSDHVGVVEDVSIDSDRRGRATVRFGRSARANEIFNDVVDGIRANVSVSYRLHRMVLEEQNEDSPNVYRATDWEPSEISFVSIPADVGVGVGRGEPGEFEIEVIGHQETRAMPKENQAQTTPAPAAPPVDVHAIETRAHETGEQAGVQREQERVKALLDVGQQYDAMDLARKFINDGGGVAELNAEILERMGHPGAVQAEVPDIGMSEREADKYSFVRAMNALANPTDRRAQEAAAFEFDASAAAAERSKRDVKGILVPVDVLKRDLNVGTGSAGGDLVATDLLSGSFIDMLRNRSIMMGICTVLTDLNGNIAIPRQTGGATGYWVAEGGPPTESQQAVDQVALSPNTVGAFTEYTRKLLLQSSIDVEAFVRNDLSRVLALSIDLAAINGSGASNQPTGILNTTGIGDVAGGTNGLAPTWDHIVDLETEVAIDNADVGSLRYITNAKVRGKLKKTFVDSGSNAERVWDTRAGETPLNGYGAGVTNQAPSNLTKGTSSGVCSAIIFGNFVDFIIGMWGGLDIMVNPYANDTSGGVRISALQDVDMAARHAESFAAMQDALTT